MLAERYSVDFEIETFNRAVITEPLNRPMAQALTRQIDPSLPGATLVSADSDAHGDTIVMTLRDAVRNAFGEVENSATLEITGRVNQVCTLILFQETRSVSSQKISLSEERRSWVPAPPAPGSAYSGLAP